MVFETADAARHFVEPPDVAEGVVYDAEGLPLVFQTDGRQTFLLEQEPPIPTRDDLRRRLLAVFEATSVEVDQSASLPTLVEQARTRFRA